ncbi:MAG TPA: hypothetical protein VLU25_09445 [Acidobacteriota bacterium]|nr:hypothetical protein [Acidobacteriota bacterium]
MSGLEDNGLGIVIPVYYPPDLDKSLIRHALQETLQCQDAYCPLSRCLLVVDRATPADEILSDAPADSPLGQVQVERLQRNRGKAGSVSRGLKALLSREDVRWIISRDCDGDHLVDDLPRFLRLAREMEERGPLFAIFGARSSYAKSMGWVRQEWENLTNALFLDFLLYLTAQRSQVVDRLYWTRDPLDLQSGYRLYSRQAAQVAARGLEALPDDPLVYSFANELLPVLDLTLQGGRAGQVPSTTRAGQAFSSYASLDPVSHYASFFAYLGRRHDLPADVLCRLLDSRLGESELFWSDHRQQVLRFRRLLCPDADPFSPPRHV